MFRRTSKTETAPVAVPEQTHEGKGRPTPSRRSAQEAARQRAKAPMDKKAARKVLRERQAERNVNMRQAMRTGEERYLPPRDKGPVKRYVRNFIDSRLTVVEFLFPILLVVLVLQYSQAPKLVSIAVAAMPIIIIVAGLDVAWMIFRVRRGLRNDLPDEETRGVTSYTVMRTIQLRWLRMPKPQVRVGGAPK